MDKSAICVNEPLNNHSKWLSKKSPQHLFMQNHDSCNILKSQLEWFFIFLIWQCEVLVYMPDVWLFCDPFFAELSAVSIRTTTQDAIHWNIISFWRPLNYLMDLYYPLTWKCIKFCYWLYCWNWIIEHNKLLKEPGSSWTVLMLSSGSVSP
jgi:hypothetical protein